MSSCDVTLLTYDGYPDLYPDDRLLLEALEALGARVRAAVWNDPSVDWSGSPVTVVRSAWDYYEHPEAFGRWINAVERATHLVNPARTIRWNMDKHYLAELESRGVTIAPSVFLEMGSAASICALCEQRGWSDVVIKPVVSGSSSGALRTVASSPRAREHAERLLERCGVILQPYLSEIDAHGERALIFIDGVFTHAVRKIPFNGIPPDGMDREESITPSERELAFAYAALDRLPERPAYARVDVVPAANGPLLMELELIEPSLFFRHEPRAAQRLAETIVRRYGIAIRT